MPHIEPAAAVEHLDLRGVRCPLNWARARVRLEDLARGATLRLTVDDPRAVRDIPRAAEACGHAVGDVVELESGGWHIDLIK